MCRGSNLTDTAVRAPAAGQRATTVRRVGGKERSMTEFDPEKFEDKYEHYFPELQRAYRQAFEAMNNSYDSELVHAIDQQILAESEPFYEDEGQFRVELPENPAEQLSAVVVDTERLEGVLERYVEELRTQLRSVFGFEDSHH